MNVSRSRLVGEALHALELDKSALTGYERLSLLSGCLLQQDSAQCFAV
jgi:hypothetical protein